MHGVIIQLLNERRLLIYLQLLLTLFTCSNQINFYLGKSALNAVSIYLKKGDSICLSASWYVSARPSRTKVILCGMVLCGMVLCGMVLCGMVCLLLCVLVSKALK